MLVDVPMRDRVDCFERTQLSFLTFSQVELKTAT